MNTDDIKATLRKLPISASTVLASRIAFRILPYLSSTREVEAFCYLNQASKHEYRWTPRSKQEHLLGIMSACDISLLGALDRSFLTFLRPSKPNAWWRDGPTMQFFHAASAASAASISAFSVDGIRGGFIGNGVIYTCLSALVAAGAELEEASEDAARAVIGALEVTRVDAMHPKHPSKTLSGTARQTPDQITTQHNAMRENIEFDLEFLHSHVPALLMHEPLWSNNPPVGWIELVTAFTKDLRSIGLGFEHWADWYLAFIAGRKIELIQLLLPVKIRMGLSFDMPMSDQQIIQVNQSLGRI